MTIRRITTTSKNELRAFHHVEEVAVAGSPLHVPELRADLMKRYTGRSPFYEDMDHALFVASDSGGDVARCAALLNRRWQRDHGEAAGHIGYFAATPDAADASREVIHAAEDWLAARGATRAIFGLNGAGFHGFGIMTGAHDESPIFPLPWHPPHYAAHVEAAGYRRAVPIWIFDVDLTSPSYRDRVASSDVSNEVTIRPIDQAEWWSEMDILRGLFNHAFRDHWQFHQHTASEWKETFAQMKGIADPRMWLIAESEGRPAGFVIGVRDLNPLFRSLGGSLGPLQILKLMRGAKKATGGGLLAIGVHDSQRGRGLARALAARVFRRFAELGETHAAYYPVNDDNKPSRSLAESFGGAGRVVYHSFEKLLR